MAGRRTSARRLSMSQAAKRHLKEKKRREKLGLVEKPAVSPEISRKTLWILAVAALVTVCIVVGLIVALES